MFYLLFFNKVKGAVGKTLPVASRLEGPIKMVDSILCSSLDFVETNLPVVKLPADEVSDSLGEFRGNDSWSSECLDPELRWCHGGVMHQCPAWTRGQ